MPQLMGTLTHESSVSTPNHALPVPSPSQRRPDAGRWHATVRRSAAARCSSAEMMRQQSGVSGQTTVNITTYPNSSVARA